jgi:hypothetical protein
MGRLSKAVLLSLLLILAGAQGAASPLCVQPVKSHAHACCMEHAQINASHSTAPSATVSSVPPCCNVAPIESTSYQPLAVAGVSHEGAPGLHAIGYIAGALPAPDLVSGRGSPRSAKLQDPPAQALLCTFLV